MNRAKATHPESIAAQQLVEALQQRFVRALEKFEGPFEPAHWLRDGGLHGGGTRLGRVETPYFNRASVNVSQVHFEDDAARAVQCATALSTIIHPTHPLAPSVHIHVSYTQPRGGPGAWRLMADLNPSHPVDEQTQRYARALEAAAPSLAEKARADGDRYFFIPALGRTRGVTHFYVEGYAPADLDAGLTQASGFGETAIDTYVELLRAAPSTPPTDAQRRAQLEYHTLYFFQVLTLDRGTTSGLLAHDQNDVGTMGSLPSHVDVALLRSWGEKVLAPQGELVNALADTAGAGHVTQAVRAALAQVVRAHFTKYPQALALQAITPVSL